jgi:hypothetical protein
MTTTNDPIAELERTTGSNWGAITPSMTGIAAFRAFCSTTSYGSGER